MFTANSMNCLTEVLGLSQPGNGSLLATHADRKQLFLNAGKRIVELAKRYYEQDDHSVLPRSIVSKAAFENAMMLDIAMGDRQIPSYICWRRHRKPKSILP